ncbi:MAG: hypothetical protein AAF138_04465 [Planctomycetota bacterium]
MRRSASRARWLSCVAGLALGAPIVGFVPMGSAMAGPTRDGHPANRPGTPGAGPAWEHKRAPFRGPRGVGGPRPTFLPPGFRGVPARAPGPGTRPPLPVRIDPDVGPERLRFAPGFLRRDASGRLIDPRFGGRFDGPAVSEHDRFGRAPLTEGTRLLLERAAGSPRPVVVLGGSRGVYAPGLILLPNESALDRLYGGYRYYGRDCYERDFGPIVVAGAAPVTGAAGPGGAMVVGGVDPRLWAWWVPAPTPSARSPGASPTGVAPAAVSGSTPRSSAIDDSLALLGLTALPPIGVVDAAGLGADVEWDADLALGLRLLAFGASEEAAEALQRRVDARPDDYASRRLLGLALLEGTEANRGARQIAEAYRGEPSLGAQPMGVALFTAGRGSGDRSRLRLLMERAVRMGGREVEGAWLAAAMLAQAEGRDRALARVLDRGSEAGVEPILLECFGVSTSN